MAGGSEADDSRVLELQLGAALAWPAVEQALQAATLGGASALRRHDIGHLGEGAKANFSVLKSNDYRHLAYRPGVQLIHNVYTEGIRS